MSGERQAPCPSMDGTHHIIDWRTYGESNISVRWIVARGDGAYGWIHEATSGSDMHDEFCIGIYTLLDIVDVLVETSPVAVEALGYWTERRPSDGEGSK